MADASPYRIDVHHHLCPPDYLAAVSRHQPMVPVLAAWSLQKSLDDMEEAGVATAILSIVPAVNFSGLFAPVSSLSGTAKILGLTFPSAWYQPITVGVFAKALGMSALWFNVVAICIIALAYLILSLLLLRKQEA